MTAPICPYCQHPAKLVDGTVIYPHRPDLASLKFWRCRQCDAYVGCHKTGNGTEPLGRLSNSQLRIWKQNAHSAFDPFWMKKVAQEIEANNGRATYGVKHRLRNEAYARLAEALGIDKESCHIGMFDVATCMTVVEICVGWREEEKV